MSEFPRIYDVVIAGGGLAGLSLARQLKRENPDRSVLVLDRLARPLPEAAFKVGESTVEVGTYYYAQVLGLADYLEENHLGKLGLRFFYPGSDDFALRPEVGLSDWPAAPTYQLDRGKLENDLRQFVLDDGVELLEGVFVKDIHLGSDADFHSVEYESVEEGGSLKKARCRWVVDATGRRRLLQRKLELTKEPERTCSAAWFRIEGELNVDDFVPASEREWHDRVLPSRYFSTNHLMGRGRWMWLIPLSSGHTSIGIVTCEQFHPFSEYSTQEAALAWIGEHEPVLAAALRNRRLLDFRTMRRYSYSSQQVFSRNRWACVGESGVFVDPYYSVGLNMIAFSNGLAANLIDSEMKGELSEELVQHANRFYLSITESLAHNIQGAYAFYDDPKVMVLKTLWDFCVGWSIADQQLYHKLYLDPKLSSVVSTMTSTIAVAQARLLELFQDWATRRSGRSDPSFAYIDYLDHLPTLKDLYLRSLPREKSIHEVLEDLRFGLNKLDGLAQTIFFMAVEDLMPEEMARFEDVRSVNIRAISLRPEDWEKDGLFRVDGQRPDYSEIEREIRDLFTIADPQGGSRSEVASIAVSASAPR